MSDKTVPRRLALPAAILAAGAMIMAGLLGHGSPAAAAPRAAATTSPLCYKAVHCLVGETAVVFDPAQPDKDKTFVILDGTRPLPAAQAWQGVGGFAENANPFCVTNLRYTSNVACLGGRWNNATGLPEVVLTQNGTHLPVIVMYQGGRRFTLTARRIAWVAAHCGC